MALSWRLKTTIVLLILGFALAAASLYLVVNQAKELRQAEQRLATANLAAEKANQAAEEARQARRAAEIDLARKRAQLLVVSDALAANQDLLSRLGRISGTNICPLGRPGLTTRELNLCQLLALTNEPFAEFLGNYTMAAGLRATADTRPELTALRDKYVALRGLARRGGATNQWLARVEEGVAYAEYRLGNLDEAQAQVDRAARLDSRSAFVGLTTLKIACTRKRPRETIQRLHSAQLAELHESLRQPAPGMDRRYANLEIQYFRNDPELTLVCNYARLPTS